MFQKVSKYGIYVCLHSYTFLYVKWVPNFKSCKDGRNNYVHILGLLRFNAPLEVEKNSMVGYGSVRNQFKGLWVF